MPTIIGLTGHAGSGKDTAANHLCTRYGFTRLSFAGPLKQVCSIVFGLTELEMSDRVLKERPLDRYPYFTPRQIMQKVGTECFRRNFEGVWLEAFKRRVAGCPLVVVPDVRFPDEAKLIRELDGRIIRIDAVGSPFATQSSGHASERSVDVIVSDDQLLNVFSYPAGLSFLHQQLDQLMSGMGVPRRDSEDELPPSMRF